MKKNLKSIEGYYYSTYAFVFKNNLEATANKVLGKGWEAEDDVNQIQKLINAMKIGKYSVECIDKIPCDEEDIIVRKESEVDYKDIDKAFRQLISLYDVCDELEMNGEDREAKKMRNTLYKIGAFIQSLKN